MLINQAEVEDLAALEGVTRHTAETLRRERPFQTWAEVRHAGAPMEQIECLKRGGAELGGASSGPIFEPGSGGSGAGPEGDVGRA